MTMATAPPTTPPTIAPTLAMPGGLGWTMRLLHAAPVHGTPLTAADTVSTWAFGTPAATKVELKRTLSCAGV